jgi:predicted nuclease of predicted toxin-antitoxin system
VKVLLDSCVWGGAKPALIAAGHDVDWSGDWPADPGDEDILARAHREGRVLITLDKDSSARGCRFPLNVSEMRASSRLEHGKGQN